MDADIAVHRALASPVRARLLALLRGGEDPQDAQALAQRVGLHVNTVRNHLAILAEAGLAHAEPEDPDGPGRPRLVYQAPESAPPQRDDPGYRFLAEVLASLMTTTIDDPPAAAEQAGLAWGRDLVGRPTSSASASTSATIKRIVALLAERGFAPELDHTSPTRPRILLHRCPFADVARQHQSVVCAVHLGLIRGALGELDARVAATALHPFVQPDLCIAQLEAST